MSECITVYAFVDEVGDDQEYVTLDKDVAKSYALANNLRLVARTYEYKGSRIIRRGKG